MSTPRSTRSRSTRWLVAGIALAAVGAVVAGTVGIAVALEPTSSPAAGSVDVDRGVTDSLPSVHLGSLSATAGSLVGGEQQVLTGRGLDEIEKIQVGGTTVTNFVVTENTLTFTMPRSTQYVAGPVEIEIIPRSESVPVVAAADLTYTYEVRTGVDRQLAYAFQHWENYNLAEFGNFNPVGGDCANFVSQTLIARGWLMTDEWFHRGGARGTSSSWIYTPAFESWLLANPELGAVRLEFDQRDQVKVGDIVVFDWNANNFLDHIQIVSAVEEVDGEFVIKMAGHNRDTNYRDLDETITIDHPNATGYFYSLPPS